MRIKLEGDIAAPVKLLQSKKKNTIRRQVYTNTIRSIQDNMDDMNNAYWDAKEEKMDEKDEELSFICKFNLFRLFDEGPVVWANHRISVQDFCEPDAVAVTVAGSGSGSGAEYPYTYGHTYKSDEEYDFWEGYDEYESFDKMLNPNLYI